MVSPAARNVSAVIRVSTGPDASSRRIFPLHSWPGGGLGAPVQFVQFFSDLTREAMEAVDETPYERAPFRVVRPDHLAAIALNVDRLKGYNRILALLNAGVVDQEALERLAVRQGLTEKWATLRREFLDE